MLIGQAIKKPLCIRQGGTYGQDRVRNTDLERVLGNLRLFQFSELQVPVNFELIETKLSRSVVP